MPKIRDLGIKVIPEGMGPLEIGAGAGGPCDCTLTCDCSNPITIFCDCSIAVTFCGCTLITCGATCACSNPVTFIDARRPPLTPETAQSLRKQLQEKLEDLDRQESALADAREKELEAELERLRALREELKKNK